MKCKRCEEEVDEVDSDGLCTDCNYSDSAFEDYDD